MRIAQIAPLYESVPPRLHGGTERVVSWLTEELVTAGHEVTLFASADSITSADLVPACPRALWKEPKMRDGLAHHMRQLEQVFDLAGRFDVLHFHTDFVHFPLLRRDARPAVTTLHGALTAVDHAPLFATYDDVAVVSISDAQRRPVPRARWQRTVHHGVPLDLHNLGDGSGGYLAFLGRASPEKGLDRAITIARRARVPLKIAVKICPEDRAYFDHVIGPMLREAGPSVQMVGEVGGDDEDRFLRQARALLFPIAWQEPFGLAMIEAMACGTPVVAWRNGATEEVVDEGVTGFVVDDIDGAVAAIDRTAALSRALCRLTFERRFGAARMAHDYVEVYRSVIEESGRPTTELQKMHRIWEISRSSPPPPMETTHARREWRQVP
jgi:glycosyltransferase involved in cell wall biosynthesis